MFWLFAFSLRARSRGCCRCSWFFTHKFAECEGWSCLNGCKGWRDTFVKRALLGTLACLVILIALAALASRWAAVFWLLLLSVSLYLLFGRNVEVEFRLGISDG